MKTNFEVNESNEIADALRSVSYCRRTRVFTAFVALTALAAAVFAAPKFSNFETIKKFLNARRFTTESIVEAKTGTKTLSNEETAERTGLVNSSTSEQSVDQTVELEFEGDESEFTEADAEPSLDRFQVDDLRTSREERESSPSDDLSESTVPVEKNDAPVESKEMEEQEETSEPSSVKSLDVPTPRSRVFARAANILQNREASSKYFARAAKIVDVKDGFSPNSFSDAAKRASESGALVATRAPQTSAPVASVDFEQPANASGGVASADYRAPKKDAQERPTRERGDLEAQRRELTPEEARSVQTARAELHEQGLLGARVERWNDQTFRATGMTRGSDGAYFNEAFGATPDEAAKALLQKAQIPSADRRPIKSGFKEAR